MADIFKSFHEQYVPVMHTTVWCNWKELRPCAKSKLHQAEKVPAQRGKVVFRKRHDKWDISFLSTNVLPGEPSRAVQR